MPPAMIRQRFDDRSAMRKFPRAKLHEEYRGWKYLVAEPQQ
jgi:hypothetical protein